MGFGSYDESEQELQEFDTDQLEKTEQYTAPTHDGEVRFEYDDASAEELLETYAALKDR